MSSHKVMCCLLGVCCPPAKQERALAEFIGAAGGSDFAATELLRQFDLVPKGVGDALVAAYRPMFKAEDATSTPDAEA